jgi:hypothetical protein
LTGAKNVFPIHGSKPVKRTKLPIVRPLHRFTGGTERTIATVFIF